MESATTLEEQAMNPITWLRNIIAAHRVRRTRAQLAGPPISECVRRLIAIHNQTVAAAIRRNSLGPADQSSVSALSADYLAAYLRGKVACIEDVTALAVDHANRLGNAATAKRVRAARDQRASASPSFVAR